jgi:tRNA C32,U32 (ribose-2'-O)-methylase TrmJ
MEFKLPTQRVTQELLWRRIAGKAFLTKKEYTALMGFLRNVQHLQRTTETKMKPETKAKRL